MGLRAPELFRDKVQERGESPTPVAMPQPCRSPARSSPTYQVPAVFGVSGTRGREPLLARATIPSVFGTT